MIMYVGMIILTVFFGVMSQRETVYNHRDISNNKSNFEGYIKPSMGCMLIILFVFVFVTGMQSDFGDTTNYRMQFENLDVSFAESLNIDWSSKAPFFQIFMAFIKNFTSEPQYFFLIVAFLTNFFVWLVMKDNSYSIAIACYFYVCMGLSLWAMNGIRQYLVATLLFLCHRLIIDGKYIKWFVLLLFCYFFHTSVLFLVPVYFLFRSKPWSKRTAIFIVAVLVVGIFYSQFSSAFFDAAEGTVFEEYDKQQSEVASTSLIRVAFMIIPAVLSYIFRDIIEKENSMLLNMSVNASVLSAGIYVLAAIGAGNLIARIAVYSDLYVYIILIPFLLKKLLNSKDQKYIAYLYIIAAGIFYFYQQFIVYGGYWYSYYLGWYFV